MSSGRLNTLDALLEEQEILRRMEREKRKMFQPLNTFLAPWNVTRSHNNIPYPDISPELEQPDLIACVPVYNEGREALLRTVTSFQETVCRRSDFYHIPHDGRPADAPANIMMVFFVDGLRRNGTVAINEESLKALCDLLYPAENPVAEYIVQWVLDTTAPGPDRKPPPFVGLLCPPLDRSWCHIRPMICVKRENGGKHDTQVQFFRHIRDWSDCIPKTSVARVTSVLSVLKDQQEPQVIEKEGNPLFRGGKLFLKGNRTPFLMVDSDTKFDTDAISLVVRFMADKCNQGDPVFGVSGQIVVALTDSMPSVGFVGRITPVIYGQYFEYKVGQALHKTAESNLGSVLCLPGAFVLIHSERSLSLVDPRPNPTDEEREMHYATPGSYTTDLGELQTVLTFNRRHLGEDRFFTTLALRRRWNTYYQGDAIATTMGPESVVRLIVQRRRWDNSTLANFFYLLSHFGDLSPRTKLVFFWNLVDTLLSFLSPGFTYVMLYLFLTATVVSADLYGWAVHLVMCVVLGACAAGMLFYKIEDMELSLLTVIGMLSVLGAIGYTYMITETLSSFLRTGVTATALRIMSLIFLVITMGSIGVSLFVADKLFAIVDLLTGLGGLFLLGVYNIFLRLYAFANMHDFSWGNRGLEQSKQGGGLFKVSAGFLLMLIVLNTALAVLILTSFSSSPDGSAGTSAVWITITAIMLGTNAVTSLPKVFIGMWNNPIYPRKADPVKLRRSWQMRKAAAIVFLIAEFALPSAAYFLPSFIPCFSGVAPSSSCPLYLSLSFQTTLIFAFGSYFFLMGLIKGLVLICIYVLRFAQNWNWFVLVWGFSAIITAVHFVWAPIPTFIMNDTITQFTGLAVHLAAFLAEVLILRVMFERESEAMHSKRARHSTATPVSPINQLRSRLQLPSSPSPVPLVSPTYGGAPQVTWGDDDDVPDSDNPVVSSAADRKMTPIAPARRIPEDALGIATGGTAVVTDSENSDDNDDAAMAGIEEAARGRRQSVPLYALTFEQERQRRESVAMADIDLSDASGEDAEADRNSDASDEDVPLPEEDDDDFRRTSVAPTTMGGGVLSKPRTRFPAASAKPQKPMIIPFADAPAAAAPPPPPAYYENEMDVETLPEVQKKSSGGSLCWAFVPIVLAMGSFAATVVCILVTGYHRSQATSWWFAVPYDVIIVDAIRFVMMLVAVLCAKTRHAQLLMVLLRVVTFLEVVYCLLKPYWLNIESVYTDRGVAVAIFVLPIGFGTLTTQICSWILESVEKAQAKRAQSSMQTGVEQSPVISEAFA